MSTSSSKPGSKGRPRHHRRSSPMLFEGCWLREGACGHRLRHTPSLCRGASGRAEGNDCRLPGSGCRIVQPAGHHLPARPLGQRVCLAIRSVAQGLQSLDLRAIRTKPYTPRTNGKAERYGLGRLRLHPDLLPGMGLWHALADLRGAEAVASSLSEALSPAQVPHAPRRPQPSAAPGRAAR